MIKAKLIIFNIFLVLGFQGTALGQVNTAEPERPFFKKIYDYISGKEAWTVQNPYLIAGSKKIDPELMNLNMLPLGSALITDAGALKDQGIVHIIHAGSGSMTKSGDKFDPTLESVSLSIKNSLRLANRYRSGSVAVPFIGGNIFLNRIGTTSEKLIQTILESVIKNKENLQIKLVGYSRADADLFQTALEKIPEHNRENVAVVQGSLVDYSVHGCAAIVNAANTEMLYGGGLSGVIGEASGNASQLDNMALQLISRYYQSLKGQ